MILATRFIMSKKEFDACINAIDKKASIDKFWLDIAGSEERAKELIKKYYGRVQEANKLFLSYQEGWKTDRGMIYIVFGAPNKVTKHKNGEVWTYGEVGNSNSVVYSFLKVINPFTDNDYYLERSETLKNPWYQAVDMWRQGRVYLDN
jgi:GWxTD domain-containing protein